MGLKRIFNEWREKADGTLTGPALETEEQAYQFPNGKTENVVPLVPNNTNDGVDSDQNTSLDFDIDLGSYDEYRVGMSLTATAGSSSAEKLRITLNNNTDNRYFANEVNAGSVSLYQATNWRFGYFDENGTSYRVSFRVGAGDSISGGNEFPNLGVFTVPESRKPAPINGYYSDDLSPSSIQMLTTNDATAQVTVKGIEKP